jgi:hypothetical protein
MEMSLKYKRIGGVVVSMLMLMMLVLSPISISHASMHAHEGAKSVMSDECKTQHSDCADDHHQHQNIGHSDDPMNVSSDDTNSGAHMCCSGICKTAIVVAYFKSNGPRYSQCEFQWQPAPMVAGKLTALHRPPKA